MGLRQLLQKKKRKPAPKEVIFGFEEHTAKAVDEEIKRIRESDVIMLEHDPKILKMIDYLGAKATSRYFRDQEMMHKLFKEIVKARMHGKEVIFYDKLGSKERKSQKAIKEKASQEDIIGLQRENAEFVRERDRKNIERILKELKKHDGKKVFISAGAMHTGIYHGIKKELDSKQTRVKREFYSERAKGRNKIRYTPLEQIARIFLFKKNLTREDEKKIKQLEKQAIKQQELMDKKVEKYMEKGMPKKEAMAKAYGEWTKEVLK